MNNITYIIPFKGSNKDRLANLEFHLYLLFNIAKFPFQYIIVEQDKTSQLTKLLNQYPQIKHIFFQTDKAFRKSVLINCGVKYSTTENIIFSDCDTVFHPCVVKKAIKDLMNFGVIGFQTCYYLTSLATKQLRVNKNIELLHHKMAVDKKRHTYLGGALTIMRKNSFWKIKGFNENFAGWGYEDAEFQHRCFKMIKFKFLSEPVWHMSHSNKNQNIRHIEHNSNLRNSIKLMEQENLENHLNQIDITTLGRSDFFDHAMF